MSDIEAITGPNLGVVRSNVQGKWNVFYRTSLQSSGLWARPFRRNSGVSFWNHSGGWGLNYPGIQGHPGSAATNGC